MNNNLGLKIGGIGGMLLVVALGFMVCLDKDSNQIWAAWIQAIGSILAICYAFYIADAENRRAAERDRLAKSDQLKRLESIAKHVASIADKVAENHIRAGMPYILPSLGSAVRNARELVSQIDINSVEGMDQILAWLEIRQVIVELQAILDSHQERTHIGLVAANFARRARAAKLFFVEGGPS